MALSGTLVSALLFFITTLAEGREQRRFRSVEKCVQRRVLLFKLGNCGDERSESDLA